jgi:hypothetical protein
MNFWSIFFTWTHNEYIGFPSTDQANTNSQPTISPKLSTKATTKPLPYQVNYLPGTPQLYWLILGTRSSMGALALGHCNS